MALQKGDTAPDFTLKSTSGKDFSLRENLGDKGCVVFFYPKDFTRGCTAEVCSFRDNFDEFRGLDIPVVGISRDSIKSHKEFKTKHQLPFELLSDGNGKVASAYKALIPFVGIPKRVTYLINKEMKVEAVFQSMFEARAHIDAMLSEISGLKKAD